MTLHGAGKANEWMDESRQQWSAPCHAESVTGTFCPHGVEICDKRLGDGHFLCGVKRTQWNPWSVNNNTVLLVHFISQDWRQGFSFCLNLSGDKLQADQLHSRKYTFKLSLRPSLEAVESSSLHHSTLSPSPPNPLPQWGTDLPLGSTSRGERKRKERRKRRTKRAGRVSWRGLMDKPGLWRREGF